MKIFFWRLPRGLPRMLRGRGPSYDAFNQLVHFFFKASWERPTDFRCLQIVDHWAVGNLHALQDVPEGVTSPLVICS